MNTKKSQTGNQYLIILAVVIIITLVVIGITGRIPGGSNALSSDIPLDEDLSDEKLSFNIKSDLFQPCDKVFQPCDNVIDKIYCVQITDLTFLDTACEMCGYHTLTDHMISNRDVLKVECDTDNYIHIRKGIDDINKWGDSTYGGDVTVHCYKW